MRLAILICFVVLLPFSTSVAGHYKDKEYSSKEHKKKAKAIKVVAENVEFDNAGTSIVSDNVQGAIEEMLPADLESILVGTWEVTQYFRETKEVLKSLVRFNADGTLEALETNWEDGVSALVTGDYNLYVGPIIEWKVLSNAFVGITGGSCGDFICVHLYPSSLSKAKIVLEKHLAVLERVE